MSDTQEERAFAWSVCLSVCLPSLSLAVRVCLAPPPSAVGTRPQVSYPVSRAQRAVRKGRIAGLSVSYRPKPRLAQTGHSFQLFRPAGKMLVALRGN
jgi:hypothetical protein